VEDLNGIPRTRSTPVLLCGQTPPLERTEEKQNAQADGWNEHRFGFFGEFGMSETHLKPGKMKPGLIQNTHF